jgi:hypothetical protein
MDQRSAVVEQDIKDIAETRLEISRKLQLIDEQARHELENLKAKWSGLTDNVAEAGKDIMNLSSRALNPTRQMAVRPWVALAGLVLAGYAIGMVRKRFRGKVYPYYPPQAEGAPVMPSEGQEEEQETKPGVYQYFPEQRPDSDQGSGLRSGQESRRDRPSFASEVWSEVKGTVETEMQRSKDAIRQAVGQFTRDMAKEIVPTILKSIFPPSRR